MRMRILGHRIVVWLGVMWLLLGCVTPPGPLLEGEETSPRPSPRGEGGNSPAATRHPLMEGDGLPRPVATPSERGNCRTLVLVDSLMWQQPDSAFALLQGFAASPEADSLDGFDGHYLQLLVSELLYKNDYQQTNRPDLRQAVAYFDSITGMHGAEASRVFVWPFQRRDASHASAQTKAFLAARAHYINGVGYYERDSVVEACREYIKALETMEGHFAEKALIGTRAKFMALTYTHLTGLFSDQYLHEQTIYFGKLSLHYY